VIEAEITNQTHLLIPFAKTKFSSEGEVTHTETLNEIELVINAFEQAIVNSRK